MLLIRGATYMAMTYIVRLTRTRAACAGRALTILGQYSQAKRLLLSEKNATASSRHDIEVMRHVAAHTTTARTRMWICRGAHEEPAAWWPSRKVLKEKLPAERCARDR